MTTARRIPRAELGLRPLHDEITDAELDVQGTLPSWLTGTLLRTGPATWEMGTTEMRHWFDGMAMLHRFTLGHGRVSYANQFLDSRSHRAAREAGRIQFGEFATDPCRSIFQRVQTLFQDNLGDNGNVNIARLGEKFMALTETSIPVEFDRQTLNSAGVPYRAPGQLSTAHPHYEKSTGALLNYAAKLGPKSSYRFYRVDERGPEVLATLPVRKPAYMHSFGITERWFVLAEFPLVVNPASLALSGKPYIENYQWRPELGTRFTLVDRQTGQAGPRFSTEAMFSFHHVNAYEDGDDVIVDLCAYRDAQIIQDLYLDRMRNSMRRGSSVAPPAHLTRIRLTGSDARVQRLHDTSLELPQINERRREREHRYVWGVGSADQWLDHIVKLDLSNGEVTQWREDHCYPGEPVFTERPGAEAEDDGVLLSIVLDSERENSFLLVLDAATLQEIARAEVPHHIPYHFHGQFSK